MTQRPGGARRRIPGLWGWLVPGLGVKRWAVTFAAGMFLASLGLAMAFGARFLGRVEEAALRLAYLASGRFLPPAAAGLAVAGAGLALAGYAVGRVVAAVAGALEPRQRRDLPRLLRSRQVLERGPRVVAIGGGTGLSTLLRGLKERTAHITAVVTVTDDGGSSGRLRGELGMLPPGDIRNCLVALADTEPLMAELFQYRFHQGAGLEGHSFGNLFIAALTQVVGDFQEAVRQSSRVLAVRGQVLPSTLQPAVLVAELSDGRVVRGESAAVRAGAPIRRVRLEPADVAPVPEALDAIGRADLIVLGPGSLFTSILPNLCIAGLVDAIRRAAAPVVYVCNVMTQPGETDGYAASDHVRAVLEHAGSGFLDWVVLNAEPVPAGLRDRYQAQGAVPVRADVREVEALGPRAVRERLLAVDGLVRHDPARLARLLLRLAEKPRRRPAAGGES